MTILAKLKEATRDQHNALESVVDVMNQTFSRLDYEALIIKFYRFYEAIEGSLPFDELRANGLDFELRRKLPLLEADLKSLGIFDKVKGTAKFTGIPRLDTLARAFGSVYVMEGATLGGQLIVRQIKESLGLQPESGGSFFYSYGPNVGPMWKQFGAAITEFAEKADRDDEIIEGARDTFDSFRSCLSESVAAVGRI